jgi:6-phosphofructokinase 1
MIESFRIEGLIVIGGNGSLAGARDLMDRGVKVMGLPGTIDNDLGFSDYTIGFDTALNTVLDAVSKVRDTSESHDRTTIIEVMGRECGDIAVHAGLAGGAEIVLVPEMPVDINDVCRRLIENKNRGKMSSIVLKAEGVDIPTDELEMMIRDKTGLDVKMIILGYLQRGGIPSARDRILAGILGSKAVELLSEGVYNKTIGIRDGEIAVDDLADGLAMKNKSFAEYSRIAEILSQ